VPAAQPSLRPIRHLPSRAHVSFVHAPLPVPLLSNFGTPGGGAERGTGHCMVHARVPPSAAHACLVLQSAARSLHAQRRLARLAAQQSCNEAGSNPGHSASDTARARTLEPPQPGMRTLEPPQPGMRTPEPPQPGHGPENRHSQSANTTSTDLGSPPDGHTTPEPTVVAPSDTLSQPSAELPTADQMFTCQPPPESSEQCIDSACIAIQAAARGLRARRLRRQPTLGVDADEHGKCMYMHYPTHAYMPPSDMSPTLGFQHLISELPGQPHSNPPSPRLASGLAIDPVSTFNSLGSGLSKAAGLHYSTLVDAHATIERERKRADATEASTRALTHELEMLKADCSCAKAECIAHAEASAEHLHAVTSRAEAAEVDAASLKSELSALEAECAHVTDAHARNINATQLMLDVSAERERLLAEAAATEHAVLANHLHAVMSRAEVAEANADALERKLSRLEAECSDLQSAHSASAEHERMLVESARAELAASAEAQQQLQSTLSALEAECAHVTDAHARNVKATQLMLDVSAERERLLTEAAAADRTAHDGYAFALRTRANAAEDNADVLERKLSTLDAECSHLTADCTAKAETLAQLQSELSASAEHERMLSEIAAAERAANAEALQQLQHTAELWTLRGRTSVHVMLDMQNAMREQHNMHAYAAFAQLCAARGFTYKDLPDGCHSISYPPLHILRSAPPLACMISNQTPPGSAFTAS
jgi:hypothetical protein